MNTRTNAARYLKRPTTSAAESAAREARLFQQLAISLTEIAREKAASITPETRTWGIDGDLKAINAALATIIAQHDDAYRGTFNNSSERDAIDTVLRDHEVAARLTAGR